MKAIIILDQQVQLFISTTPHIVTLDVWQSLRKYYRRLFPGFQQGVCLQLHLKVFEHYDNILWHIDRLIRRFDKFALERGLEERGGVMEFEDLLFWVDRYMDNAVEDITFQAFAEMADVALERLGFSEAGHT